MYKEEYQECKSFTGKFHQYFSGNEHHADCIQLWKDYENCLLWTTKSNERARIELEKREVDIVKSIAERRTKLWKYRTEPPKMWNFPGWNLNQQKQNATETKLDNN